MYKPDNYSAFPSAYGECRGMTLRDWFAGQALAGYSANEQMHSTAHEIVAHVAYNAADAMLAERSKAI